MRKLWQFQGGIHPKFNKEMSNQTPIKQAEIPTHLIVPLLQSAGQGAESVVDVGDYVYKGQVIANKVSPLSTFVHAPTSGTIIAIDDQLIPHASGLNGRCVTIECDAKDDWGNQRLSPLPDFNTYDSSTLHTRIQDCGIVGLGGAAFPTAIKTQGSKGKLETLIINGAECEPYISCDDRLMQERSVELVQGIQILLHMLSPKQCIIAIEDNKPQAIAALIDASEQISTIEVVSIPTIYPSGGEKQLIQILTGKEVPSDGLPIDLGLLSLNSATVYSIYKAVIHGEPLISRVVTVTGNGVQYPQNIEALIGSPFHHLAQQAGGYTDKAEHLIMGGPMMGFALQDDKAPMVKATNCVLFISNDALNESNTKHSTQTTLPCIRCGKCMDVCPVKLLPQQLFWHIQAKDLDKAVVHNLHDCIDCGCCSYVCPSHIPLVDYYRYAKTEIREQQLATEKSNIARDRYEFLQFRRERDKHEREEKRAAHKAALQKKKAEAQANVATGEKPEDPKQVAIKAAMERVKAKKLAKKQQENTQAKE